jgi:hypothetical protein
MPSSTSASSPKKKKNATTPPTGPSVPTTPSSYFLRSQKSDSRPGITPTTNPYSILTSSSPTKETSQPPMIPALNFSKAVSNTKTPSLSPTTTDEPAPPKTLNKGSASLKKEESMIQSSFSTETDAIVTAINESSIALAKTLLNCMQESTKGLVKLQEIAINNTSVIQDVSKTISQTSLKTNSEIRQGFDELNARFTSQEQFFLNQQYRPQSPQLPPTSPVSIASVRTDKPIVKEENSTSTLHPPSTMHAWWDKLNSTSQENLPDKSNDDDYSYEDYHLSDTNSQTSNCHQHDKVYPQETQSHAKEQTNKNKNNKNQPMFSANEISIAISGNDSKIKYAAIATELKNVKLLNDSTQQLEDFFSSFMIAVTFGFQINLDFLPTFEELTPQINFKRLFLRNIIDNITIRKVTAVYTRIGRIFKQVLLKDTCISATYAPKAQRIISTNRFLDGWAIMEALLKKRAPSCGATPDSDLDVQRAALAMQQGESYHQFYERCHHLITEYRL